MNNMPRQPHSLVMQTDHKKLERLMLFHQVAKCLSFTEAAKALGISKSHLSAQIRRLEKELNVPLLVRTTRNVKLTSQGELIAQGTSSIQSSLINIERTVSRDNDDVEGLIKITAPLMFAQCYLMDICREFKVHYPLVRFSIDCSYTSHDLNQRDFDLAIRATDSPPENMIVRELLPYMSLCYASPGYIAQHGEPTSVVDLVNHQCLVGPDQQRWHFISGSVEIDGWLKVNDNNLLKRCAIAGEGIVKIPEYYAKKEVALGELLPVLHNQSLRERTIYLVYPQVIFQSKKTKVFIEYLIDKVKTKSFGVLD